MTQATPDTGRPMSDDDLQDLVASSDTGGRNPQGAVKRLLLGVAVLWSLFQVWIASPLPFLFAEWTGLSVVLNSTEERSIHLALALFLCFLAFPAFKGSPRAYVPVSDWILAAAGTFCAGYLFLFYNQLALRPGDPTMVDVGVFCVGVVVLLEATRRALGPPLMIVAMVFLAYTFFGPYMPSIIAHKGNSLSEIATHQWLTTEGVFGIALGVSTKFVFLFVLFGALLDKAGAGNYFIKVAFSLMGHFRGGPAKAAVVASAMTGLISGSSIANVVTTGTFTVPMMRRVGFSREKAGAVEVASSVNGQIMPPVMGAAAFLMVEYVGIAYFDVVTHAILPALISYIALVYIVHLEAMKVGMQSLSKPKVSDQPWFITVMGVLFGFLVMAALAFGVYYGLGWLYPVLGEATLLAIAGGLFVAYVALLAFGSRYPDLPLDDPNEPVVELPETGPTVKSGLYFLLPVIVLVWCLMVERLSPGLSAFWATAFMVFIVVTQRPLLALFRGESLSGQFVRGWNELIDGLITGARNMIGIGIATATAGIIVGAVSQTGVGAALADLVEVLSMGNLILTLVLVAVLSLILGMGLPTTANYIVVSSLMAGVVVELGQQQGLIVPLVAVHLFVFYFGIMADVTPPVGLASFAAAAVSGGDPIKTGFVAFYYSLRTAALPFLFIFNTDLLLIDVTVVQGIVVFIVSTIGMLVFSAATMGWMFTRNRFYETAALLLITFTLFRPGYWMDQIVAPYEDAAPQRIEALIAEVPPGQSMRLWVDGFDEFGAPKQFVVELPVPDGETGAERLEALGLTLIEGDDHMLIDNVEYGSPAAGLGLDWDQKITNLRVPVAQPWKELMFIPALLLLGLVGYGQLQRRRGTGRSGPAASVATA